MNEWQVVMLASGSKGNSALLNTGKQKILIDMGISCRETVKRLREAHTEPQDLTGVFITHEHIDHVRGLGTFLKKYDIPVYTSEKTWQAILQRNPKLERRFCRVISNNLILGDLRIDSFSIPHDAVDPHGYMVTNLANGKKCTYLTDTGFVTDVVREAVTNSQTLILEANHDVEMLKNGSYPVELKQRILSTRGHLSNDSAGWLLCEQQRLPEHVILAHLSEQNNRPQLASDTVKNLLESKNKLQETQIYVAAQSHIVANFVWQQPSIFDEE